MLKMLQTNCNSNTMESQVSIASRLKKLSEWQEEQKRSLDERQNMQRKMLGLEHLNMYEKLGLFHDSSDLIENENDSCGDTSLDQAKRHGNLFDSEIIEMEKILLQGSNKAQVKFSNHTNCSNNLYESDELEMKDMKPKRPFLKRGEGIKQRYKISPEALRLNNLPRYKYATNHPKIKNLQRRRLAPKAKPSQENASEKAKRLDSIDIDESEKLDENEKQFQQMLTKSKPGYSSTPDVKLPKPVISSISITLPKVRLPEGANELNQHYEDNNPNKQIEPYDAITWSKVLDPQILKPIPLKEIRAAAATKRNNHNHKENIDDENLSIFELLERQAAEGTIDMNSSCMKNFFDHKRSHESKEENEINIPVDKSYAEVGLRPAVEEVLKNDSDDDDDNTSDTTEELATRRQTPQTSNFLSEETKIDSTLNGADKVDLRVRFSGENTTCEYDTRDDIISDSSVLLDEETASNKSSDLFHQFKDALFSALLGKNDGEGSNNNTEQRLMMLPPPPPSALTQELQEKSNIIKLRLEELDKEIAAFRSNNMELMRAKQEYEMERAHFSQERNEAMDRLKDDKIQMEMYLHDERMKIEEDRRKFENQMRVQKQTLTNKERKEIARLKEEVDALQMQLKQKDQLHASAQARLRVQIKNLEREQKQLYEEIERLTKENKRLQSEKQKIERDGNNKMLMEINRNIAKLAPKLNAISSYNTSPDQVDTTNRSQGKHKKLIHSPPVPKTNNKIQSLMKAPPNTRNTSRTNIANDVENISTLYKVENSDRHAIYEDDGDDDEDDDNDDDDIISELKMTQNNNKSLKSIQSSSRSNTSKETVVFKCDNEITTKVDDKTTNGLDSGTNDFTTKTKGINSKCKAEVGENFTRQLINPDGSRDIWYPNGNLKKISADGMNIRMLYFNKDIKETNVNEGTVKYYYAETNIWHTTYIDGLEILEFPNGQIEHRYKNGIVEIHLPDNSVKITNPAEKDKLEEWRFPDGTNLIQMCNGDRILMLPNGQKEIHTKLNKRREYPDGTVKLVYPDGSQETRYSNGRVRLKDKEGNLVLDTERN